MSFQAMTWAVDKQCGGSSAKLVLLMLANHTNNHTGQCNPRHKLLASECDMTVDTLKANLKKLESMGLIEVIPQFAEEVQLPNQYRLNIDVGGVEFSVEGGGKNQVGGGGDFHPSYKQEGKPRIEPSPVGVSIQDLKLLKTKIEITPEALDWLRARKSKRAALLTETAWAAMVSQAEKAGITVSAAVSVCAERGWQSFRSDWMKNGDGGGDKPAGLNLIGAI